MAELDEDEIRYLRLVMIVNTFVPKALRLAFPRMWDERYTYDKWSDDAGAKREASGKLLLKGNLELHEVEGNIVWTGTKVKYDGDLRGHCRKGAKIVHSFRGKIDFIASELELEDGEIDVMVKAANKKLNIESEGPTLAKQVDRLAAELGYEGKRDDTLERQIELNDPDNPNMFPNPLSCQVKVDFRVDPNTGTATTILTLPKEHDLCKLQEKSSKSQAPEAYAGKLVLRVPRVLPPRQTTKDISADAENKILKQGLAQWDITRFNWAIGDQGHGLADDLVRKAVGAMNEVRNQKFGHAVGGKVDPDTFKKAKDTFIAMLEELLKPHYLKADEKENLRKMLENLEKDTFLRVDLDEARKDQLRVLIPQLDMRSPESLKKLLKLWGLIDQVDVDEVTRTLKPAELATLVAVGESELFPHWSTDKRKQLLDIRKLLHSEWLLPHPKTETTSQQPARNLSERQMQRAQKVRSARRHCTPSPSASPLVRVPFAVGLGHRARSGQRARQSADARPGQTHDGQTNPNLRERENLSGPGPRR